LARVEELLNVRATSPTAINRERYRERQIPRESVLESPENWPALPLEPTRGLSDINNQEHGLNPPQVESQPVSNLEHSILRDEDTVNGLGGHGSSKKGHGSLVVNKQGDLQYLGTMETTPLVIFANTKPVRYRAILWLFSSITGN
jgi:hypothetical protein